MANLKDLRTRIASVKNTRKITSAMSRIAAARLRRAQNAVVAARPYGERMRTVLGHLTSSVDPNEAGAIHGLMQRREVKRVGVVVLTADRGLCGGFNANANKAADRLGESFRDAGRQVVMTTVGKKGRSYFEHRDATIEAPRNAATLDDVVALAKRVAADLMGMFRPHEADTSLPQVDEVHLVYNRFVSVLTQEVTVEQLLPFPIADTLPSDGAPEPKFEPNRTELLEHLLPVALESALQQAMFESIAAEVAARRNAMNSASENATELIGELTLQYNRERQAAITKELMEIIGGAEALKG